MLMAVVRLYQRCNHFNCFDILVDTFLFLRCHSFADCTTMFSRNCSALARRVVPSVVSRSTPLGARWIHIEKRLEELGLELPPPAPPRANYSSTCQAPGSNMVFMSGHLPFQHDGKTLITGRIGEDGRDVDYGYKAARQIGLNLIATLKEQLGDLDRVEKVVKVRLIIVRGEMITAFLVCARM